MAIIKLGCGPLGALTRSGAAEGEAEGKSDDEAERDAKEKAARSAMRKALEAAAKLAHLRCPLACPEKRLDITIDAPTTDGAEHAATKGKWKCSADAAWHLKIHCFEAAGKLKGYATLPGTEADPVQLRCGKPVIRNDTESGKVEAVTPKSAAQKTAQAQAENAAFSHIEDTLKKFTCRGRCRTRKITLVIGPPKTTVGPNPTTNSDVWDKNSMFDCEAECGWQLSIECQQ